MIFRSKLASLSMAAISLAMGTIWFVKASHAQPKATGYRAWGMMGVATGQTLRFNAASVSVDHEVPVDLIVLDGEANVVGRKIDRLQPGHATFVDVPFPAGARTNRVQLRGLVRWGSDLGREGYLISSIEVIDDATGKTTVLAIPNPEA